MAAPPPPRPIVLDDTDPSIRYLGSGWFLDASGESEVIGNYGLVYNHTLHGTHVNGQISFDFRGTSILILGTSPSQNNSNPMVNWECFIDGASIGKDQFSPVPLNYWVLCRKENLADTSHSLNIDIQVKSVDYMFLFDQIHYTPSADVPRDNSVVLFDSYDPAVQYDSLWKDFGGMNMTTQTGATVRFNFTGTSVSWYGYTPRDFPQTPSTAVYSIDGGGETEFAVPGILDGSDTSIYNRHLFTVQGLEQGHHSLRVTWLGSLLNNTPLTLDWLLVKNETTASEPSEPPSKPPGSSISPRNIGPIVGGVVGGLVALIIVAAVILWMCRGRRKAHLRKNKVQPEEDITPFTVTPPFTRVLPSTSRILNNKSPNLDNLSVPPPVPAPAAGSSNDRAVNRNVRADGTGIQPISGTASTVNNVNYADFHAIRHQDSGLRMQHTDIPPYYTPT